ncbi:MAG: TPM domain-containing protein [Minicystis sp.]
MSPTPPRSPSPSPSPLPARLHRAVFLLLSLLALLGISWSALAFTPPALSGPVVDQAGVLAPADKARIEAKLRALKGTSGPQVAVLLLSSLGGQPVEDVAYATAKAWKLGDAQRDDGVLLLISTGERKIRIETGKGVGGALTDLECNEIIRERIGPALKRGSYAAGIEAGVDAIAAKLSGQPMPRSPNAPPEWFPEVLTLSLLLIFGLVIFAIIKAISNANKRGGGSGGGAQGNDYQSSSSDYSSGGGGSDYSGGGGDFGGGGSSGDY